MLQKRKLKTKAIEDMLPESKELSLPLTLLVWNGLTTSLSWDVC